ncbi:MAG: inositol monophosphatase [Akkermansia sp.]|nr:inositol monophosphatase [Akkermansia sp.]
MQAARHAAQLAGAFLREQFHSVKQVDEALLHDIKLRLDKESQALIAGSLLAAFPQSCILGEEGNDGNASAEYQWIVDPIDGTVNYFYGIPIFCVSIALQHRGRLVLGCVYDPMQQECFEAIVGCQPLLNGAPISVSARTEMREAVVFIGHGTHDGSGEAGIRRFAHLSRQVRKIRILGSAALTLCYIAAGRFDAYVEGRICLWDFAAARVILEAAGGKLEFEPFGDDGIKGSIMAWNGRIPLYEALQMED